MRISFTALLLVLMISCTNGKENTYTGSTPAGNIVRSFLGIPLTDSIDFIRWKLTLAKNNYRLHCNYGIGKPNTNGFIQGGKNIELSGALKTNKEQLQLQHGDQLIKLAVLDNDLLHFLDEENRFLTGNGGWSYTLGHIRPSGTGEVPTFSLQNNVGDSMIFIGRTPCGIPGLIQDGTSCYKLKWRLSLYKGKGDGPGQYMIFGTLWPRDAVRTGTWTTFKTTGGRVLYRLDGNQENIPLYLFMPGEQIVLFTDARGKLLVGNEDLSYTLNKTL